MGIGQSVGSALVNVASDLALMTFGVLCVVLVISGLIIVSHIGGQGIQKHVRGAFLSILWAALFSGAFKVIASGAQKLFATGG